MIVGVCRVTIAMCVCLLIGGPASGQARDQASASAAACDITQDRSRPGTTPATIEFVNQTAGTVHVYWLAFDGSRQFWFSLAAGRSQMQGTYIGHAWLVTDVAGTCVGFVVSDQAQKRYVIVGSAPAPIGPSSTFTDPTGDGVQGADIVSVTVSNDAAGQISMRIAFARLRFDDTFILCLDVDRNRGTGLQDLRFCPLGADYDLYAHWYGAWEVVSFTRWTGPGIGSGQPAPRTTGSISGDANGVSVSINRNELSGTNGFDFQLWTEPVPGDRAPDAGTWSYTLQTSKPPAPTAPRGKTIVGSLKDDVLRGTGKADRIFGRDGNDRLYGLAGDDFLDGGRGNDLLVGGLGKDRIRCGLGRDTVLAGAGDTVAADCEVVNGLSKPPPPTCSNGRDDDGDGRADYPADPGCSSSSDTDEADPLPPAVEVTPGSYKGQTQTGDFVFFDVLPDRTIRGFRANDLRQECDGPLIIYGPLDFGPTPNPIRADGTFLYQYDGPGTISGEKGELFAATFHIKVTGSIRGSSASGTAIFSSEFDYQDRHWRCSSGERTWTANRVP